MAYKQPHRNVTPAKQMDEGPVQLPEPSPLMQVHNMTPNVSEAEAKKVRNKFDRTYMKKEVVGKQPMFVSTDMKDFKLNTQERRDEYTRRNWKQDETTTVKPVTQKAGGWKKTALNIAKGVGLHPAGHALVAISKHPKVKQVVQKFSEGAKDVLENITKPRPELQTGGGGPIKQSEYIKAQGSDGKWKKIEGEEISREEFFHTGPYDYKTTKTYRDEMSRVNDSLTNTGDIPSIKDQKAWTAYYSGPHKKHNHLFPGGGSLKKYASMSAEDQKKYFKKKKVKPTFPIEK